MSNLAFEIGFDHYRFDLALDLSRFSEEHLQQVQYGFEAGKIQNVSKQHINKFEKKILSIRDRCLKNGYEVTITANDLIEKLQQTNGVCPITEEPFTFAHQEMTDWSVDRVDNTRGYCPDNIEIVSVKANKAKGDLDLEHIIEQAVCKYNPNSLLSQRQWYLLGQFYYSRLTLTEPVCMTDILLSSPVVFFKVLCLPFYMPKENCSKTLLNLLSKYGSNETVIRTQKLLTKRRKKHPYKGLHLVVSSPKLSDAIFSFFTVIAENYLAFDEVLTTIFFHMNPDIISEEPYQPFKDKYKHSEIPNS